VTKIVALYSLVWCIIKINVSERVYEHPARVDQCSTVHRNQCNQRNLSGSFGLYGATHGPGSIGTSLPDAGWCTRSPPAMGGEREWSEQVGPAPAAEDSRRVAHATATRQPLILTVFRLQMWFITCSLWRFFCNRKSFTTGVGFETCSECFFRF